MDDQRKRIGIVVAVREELQAILHQLPLNDKESLGGSCFYCDTESGKSVVLAKSGMGVQRAEQTAQALLTRYPINTLLIAGFGGALSKQVSPGDLVIARAVINAPPSGAPEWFTADPALLAKARAVRPPGVVIHCGGLITTGVLAPTAAGKRALAASTSDVLAMDMETAGAAQAAQAAGIPWIAVRAITDGLDDDFPFDFAAFTDPADGETNRARVLLAALTHPWKIPALIRLGMRSSRAAGNLAAFLESYLRAMGDERNRTRTT